MRQLLGYSNVWEDAATLLAALRPVAPAQSLLSITAAGDNALALLVLDPREVVAVDRNPAQSALLELRSAAFAGIASHDLLLAFLGVCKADDRLATYGALRGRLSPHARAFWDGRRQHIRDGVIHAGRFERYLRFFARRVLPRLQPAAIVHRLLELPDTQTRQSYYDTVWCTRRWRLATRLLFDPLPVGLFARDVAAPRNEARLLTELLVARTRTVLTSGAPAANPYLHYALFGNFSSECLPLYLRAEHFALIRSRLDRLRMVTSRLEDFRPAVPIMGFNLSDVLDHTPPGLRPRVFQHVLRIAAPGARMVLWNLLAPTAAAPLPGLTRLAEVSDTLLATTMTPSYSGVSVYQYRPCDRRIALDTPPDTPEP